VSPTPVTIGAKYRNIRTGTTVKVRSLSTTHITVTDLDTGERVNVPVLDFGASYRPKVTQPTGGQS
jgi:hypothetical protein